MSYERLSYEELTQLPLGSKIAFRPEGGSTAEVRERAMFKIFGLEYDGFGISVMELREDGWYVIEDDKTPAFVGFGPFTSEKLKSEYDNGDWFSLVVKDEDSEVAA